MSEHEYFQVKKEWAFASIKGQRLIIIGDIPETEQGVYVRTVDTRSIETYKFQRCELEPWVEPVKKSKKIDLGNLGEAFLEAVAAGYGTFDYMGASYSCREFAADKLKLHRK